MNEDIEFWTMDDQMADFLAGLKELTTADLDLTDVKDPYNV